MEYKGVSDTRNNRGNQNHFRIFQTIPERSTKKSQNQGTTDNSHIWRFTFTSESMCIKVHNIQCGK